MIVQDDKLCMWVVYDRPDDFPEQAIARLWVLEEPTELMLFAPTIAVINSLITEKHPDLFFIPRMHDDDPKIVGVWL